MKFSNVALALILLLFVGRSYADSMDNSGMLTEAQSAFSACAGLQGVNIVRDGKVICLRGKIDSAMYISLLKLKDKIKDNPYVIISGPGGYADSSLYIINTLEAYDPIPVVGDMCASACGQFLILMGKHRVFLHCADVAMHGGPRSLADELALNVTDDVKQRTIAGDAQWLKFYKDRKISLDMVTKPPPDIQRQLNSGKIVFWPWSIDKLRSFGVQGIVSDNDPSTVVPADYAQVCLKHDGS